MYIQIKYNSILYMNSLNNLFILFSILIIVALLYKSYSNKIKKEDNENIDEALRNFLLDDVTLGMSKKPILWIHIPYEYNSRKWLSFGSRSSFDLNQPYLYLTVKSIIKHCDDDFTICIIDDNAFHRLIPGWDVNMTTISDPILSNMRTLGLMKLLYIYGGLMCPISFLCMKNLNGLYNKGIHHNKMFVCETIDTNITSSEYNFYPNISFCGAPKKNETVYYLCDFIQRIISVDYTSQSVFLGDFNRWINSRINKGKINLIDGTEIGTKTSDNKTIVLENLMSNHYLDIYPQTYGILIPSDEILKRVKYEWFARMSAKQVLNSNTIIGNYLLLANSPEGGIIEPLEMKPNWVGFWKTPLYPGLYMVSQPNYLGNNLIKKDYTER